MAVSAKFRVTRITPQYEQEYQGEKVLLKEFELTPDYAMGKNAEWAAATPMGVIRMSVLNPKAQEQFGDEVGKPCTILFEFDEE